MALTINTPYKTNTLASVSGTTFTSNGTPFASTDVGRFLVFTDGPAIGQIRRITARSSTTVVTVDAAWNASPFTEFSDSLPVAGNTWQMSLNFDDIDDGVHIIKDSTESYRQVVAAGLVTFTGVFVADVSKSLILAIDMWRLGTTSRLCLGYLHPNGYGMLGCTIFDYCNTFDGFSTSGSSGDVHLYGCNVNSLPPSGNPFWRLHRSDDHIVRFVDCDFSGDFGGRVRGKRSLLLRCTYRGNVGANAGINAVATMGLVKECRMQASNQAIYIGFSSGTGDITSPRFNAISGRIVNGAIAAAATGFISDYIQSEVEAAPSVFTGNSNSPTAQLVFRQYVDATLVNQALAAITDSSRRVIRNGAASVVDNVTTTSGTFSRYVAVINSYGMINGTQNWAAGTKSGPYEEAIGSYLYSPQTLALPLPTSSNVQFTMITDSAITQTTKATVDAYTTLDDLGRLYDRYKSWFVDNLATAYPTFGVQKIVGDGTKLNSGSANFLIDATAGSAFDVNTGTDTITLKSTTLAVSSKFTTLRTTGTISFANGATSTCTLQGIVVRGTTGVYSPSLDTATMRFTTAGTYDMRSASIVGTLTLTNTSGSPVTVQLQPSVSVVNSGPNITVDNVVSYTLEFTGLRSGSEVRCYTGTDPATTAEIGGIESSSTSFSFSHTSGGVAGVIVIASLGYINISIPITYASANQSIPISQQIDRQYNNP